MNYREEAKKFVDMVSQKSTLSIDEHSILLHFGDWLNDLAEVERSKCLCSHCLHEKNIAEIYEIHKERLEYEKEKRLAEIRARYLKAGLECACSNKP